MNFHPIANLFPLMNEQDLDAFARDIQENGLLHPITLLDQTILDGRNRWLACEKISVEPTFVSFDGADPLRFVISSNLQRRHLSPKQRACIAADLATMQRTDTLKRGPDGPIGPSEKITNSQAAEMMGVGERSVKRAKALREANPEQFEAIKAGLVSGRRNTSGEQDWHTPELYLELAREVLGGFDLDPASSTAAQKRVKARRHYTEDGLNKPWKGKTWLNPPYAQPHVANFVGKLVKEHQVGNVSAAVLLVNNCTDTAWLHNAARASTATCFTKGRIAFLEGASGEPQPNPVCGQVFLYFGPEPEKFCTEFQSVGIVISGSWI